MDTLDKVLEKIDRLGIAERIIIRILLVAGIMSLALLTPGLFSTFGPMRYAKKTPTKKNVQGNTLPRLIQKGIIKKYMREGVVYIELTPYGRELGNALCLDIVQSISQKKMSKDIYTVISFDIPERERIKRDIFRNFLKEIGCEYFHQSFWLFKGDIRKEIKEIRERLESERYIFACISKKTSFLIID